MIRIQVVVLKSMARVKLPLMDSRIKGDEGELG